ncbi:MAG: hypothetical protein IPI79_00850 [Moraxellaceae bacterium]|nr:hypothetical protein [Moraxellaceae bacterium]
MENGKAAQEALDALSEIKQAIENLPISELMSLNEDVSGRLIYAAGQTSFDELLAVIKAETQVREVLDSILGEGSLQKLDIAFEAVTTTQQQEAKNVTTNTSSTVKAQSGSTPTEVSETDTTGAATIPTVPTTNAGSQNGKGDLGNSAGVSTEDSESPIATEDGIVTVLKGVTEAVREEERNQPFNLRNLIKAYFTQKKGDASNSPLVLVKDFISNLNVVAELSKYLSTLCTCYYKSISRRVL